MNSECFPRDIQLNPLLLNFQWEETDQSPLGHPQKSSRFCIQQILSPHAVSLILKPWNAQLNVRARAPDLPSLNSGPTLGWAVLCHICQQKVRIILQHLGSSGHSTAKTVVPHECKRLVPRVLGTKTHRNSSLV